MKDKRGFTLIELLVTIAIMLTILGIAVVSIINVSKAKKEESWEAVKEEVKAAAIDYLNSNPNANVVQNANGDNTFPYVSVGTLVEKDYLNKVTNPLTNKAVSTCDFVGLEDNKYVYYSQSDDGTNVVEGYEISEEKCKYSSYASEDKSSTPESSSQPNSSSDPEPPSTPDSEQDIELVCPKFTYSNANEKGWYNSDVNVTIEPSNGTDYWLWCTGYYENGKWTKENCSSSNNTSSRKISIGGEGIRGGLVKVYDSKGKSKNCYTSKLNIDKTSPTLSVKLYKKNSSTDKSSYSGLSSLSDNIWINKYAFTYATYSDNLSGIDTISYNATGATTNGTANKRYRNVNAEGISYIVYKACDKAGNCSESKKFTIKLDRTAPNVITEGHGQVYCKKPDNSGQYNSAGFSLKYEDPLSGLKSETIKYCSAGGCDDVTSSNWSSKKLSTAITNISGSEKTHSQFTGVYNKKSMMSFTLEDKVGNKKTYGPYSVSSRKTVTGGSEYKKVCNTGTWYTKNR